MSSEAVKLPAIPPAASAAAGSQRSSIGNNSASGSVPLPHLIPSPDPHHGTPHSPSPGPSPASSPANVSHPSPDQSSPRASVFITALPEDHDSTAQSVRRDSSPDRREMRRSVHWHAPHAAKRVGSYIRDLKYTIHLRGCSKCRKEGEIVKAPQDRAFGGGGAFIEARRQSGHYSDGGRQRSGGSGGRVGRGAGGSAGTGSVEIWGSGHRGARGGRPRDDGGGKHCSSRCVHLSGLSGHPGTAGGAPGGAGETARRRSRSKRKYTVVSDRYAPARVGSPDPAEVITLSIYHKHDWEEMTWDQLLATLVTNTAKGKKERTKMNFKQFQVLKKEIIAAIEEGHILKRDPRLKWENRRLLLVLQVTKLMRTRDIYKAIQEALVNHNAELRRLAQLFEVRAYREVHAMKVDYLKSGSTLFRFTAIPGRLCRGINLYQACLAVVYGRRWSILVLRRQQRRTKEQVEAVNAEIEKVLHYKFQELPVDKMRVSHLLKQLEDQMKWFEDVKHQMTGSVESLFSDLEERRQREIEVTIVEAMDACVDQQEEWAGLYDFHRCLSGLCSDMAERNALLRRQIAETRHAHRHRDKADDEWKAWILQDRAPADGGDASLRISRRKWLPV